MNGDAPIGELLGQLMDDGKRYALAEVQVYKAKAVDRAQPLKTAAIFGALALVLSLSAVTALLVGLILALAPATGPLAATAIVVVGAILIAMLLGYLAYRRAMEMAR